MDHESSIQEKVELRSRKIDHESYVTSRPTRTPRILRILALSSASLSSANVSPAVILLPHFSSPLHIAPIVAVSGNNSSHFNIISEA